MMADDGELGASLGAGGAGNPDGTEDASVSSTYARLRRAWLNERCAPALLPYEGQLAESAAEHVEMALAELEERRAAAAEAAAAGRQAGTAADEESCLAVNRDACEHRLLTIQNGLDTVTGDSLFGTGKIDVGDT